MRCLSLISAAFAATLLAVAPAVGAKQADIPETIAIAEPSQATEFTQDYDIKPAIWRLRDDDTTIYMFGTIHLLPPGFEWRSERFDRIVEEVDELVVESSDADITASYADLLPMMTKHSTIGKPISSRMSSAGAKKWHKLARLMGMDPSVLDRTPIILTMFAFGEMASSETGSLRSHGVETVLEAEFSEAGKPIGSIEDPNDVLSRLLAIDEQLIINEMEAGLTKWDGSSAASLMSGGTPSTSDRPETNDPLALEHAWASGKRSDVDFADGDGSKFLQSFWRVLLNDRNEQWVEWLDDRLDRPGTLLLAVGAAHFEGENSVLAKLAERGFRIRRIQ